MNEKEMALKYKPSNRKTGGVDIFLWGQKYTIFQGSNYFHFNFWVLHQLSSNDTK